MKKKVQSSKEQGQAIVEMCICMIPILVVFVGMIFVSGLGISNIRAFTIAKASAELASRSNNAIGGYGDNIYRWDYGEDDDKDGLPFTKDDDFYGNSLQSGMETLVTQQLNDSLYSQENERGYDFMPTTELVNFNSDYDTMLAAADLVETDPNNLDTNGVRKFDLSIGEILGISISTDDLSDMRANIVYYPALPTESSSSGGERRRRRRSN